MLTEMKAKQGYEPGSPVRIKQKHSFGALPFALAGAFFGLLMFVFLFLQIFSTLVQATRVREFTAI
jgi:hypothetical protein